MRGAGIKGFSESLFICFDVITGAVMMRFTWCAFACFSLIIVAPAIDETDDLIFAFEAASASGNENDFLWGPSAPVLHLTTGEPDVGISTDESFAFFAEGSDGGAVDHENPFTIAILDDQWSTLDMSSDCPITDGSAMGMMRRGSKCPASDELMYPSEDTTSSPVANPGAPVYESC